MPGYEMFGDEEKKEVQDVLDTGILLRYGFEAQRKNIWKSKQLEVAIAERLSVRYAQLTSSGTTALTTALASLGVGYGDEVLVPTFTFVATVESILSVGAIPVFVDIDDSMTMNPVAAEQAITAQTKCIVPVHMCGAMADIEKLLALATRKKILLLEDACQSMAASYKGKPLGSFGDAGVFSFDFVKTMTCGEGGVVVTNNEDIYKKCHGYSDHGHDHLGVDRGADQHHFIGNNFRISELHAAVGLAQIRKIDTFLLIQRKNYEILYNYMQTIPQLQFRKIYDSAGNSCTFLGCIFPTKTITEKVVEKMKLENIFAGGFHYYNNNWHYLKKWEHFKKAHSLYPLNTLQVASLQKIENRNFSISDDLMARTVFFAISLVWKEEEIAIRAKKMIAVIASCLS
ncbi:MAG: DegT/DnrJ/EryC1/StrS family aminotransferase [Phycisphaerales bacterium]|nr:DegT/DnrJ/EryC1/StrS family aminotransferase [Phycisphaerales bacterium]